MDFSAPFVKLGSLYNWISIYITNYAVNISLIQT